MILACTVLIQLTSVTDGPTVGRTDGQTDGRPDDGKDARSILLSRVKNILPSLYLLPEKYSQEIVEQLRPLKTFEHFSVRTKKFKVCFILFSDNILSDILCNVYYHIY